MKQRIPVLILALTLPFVLLNSLTHAGLHDVPRVSLIDGAQRDSPRPDPDADGDRADVQVGRRLCLFTQSAE